jgi:hypothetical protein
MLMRRQEDDASELDLPALEQPAVFIFVAELASEEAETRAQ